MQEENIYIEEDRLSLFEVLKVLFGRKLLLLIVSLGLTVLATIGAFAYNSINRTYESNFTFSEDVLNKTGEKLATNLNDTEFDIRKYFNEEALEFYRDNNSKLKNIDVNKIINNNGIEEAKWYVIEEYNSETGTYRTVKENYRVIVKKSSLGAEETKELLKEATNKVLSDNVNYLKELDRDEFVGLYESAILFEDKVGNLEKEFNYIIEKYNALLERFGNVKALDNDDKLISNYKNEVSTCFQNTNFNDLLKEINNKSLVYDKEQTKTLLEAQLNDAEMELKYINNEKTDLINQRNAIIIASDGKLTLDLESYNSKIVELTEKSYEIEKEKEMISKKISVINATSSSVVSENEKNVSQFNLKLSSLAEKLKQYAKDLGDIEVYQYEKNMKCYFETTAIIKSINSISIIEVAAISLVLGFVAGLVTNLCLDGKKLTKEYKKEHENK